MKYRPEYPRGPFASLEGARLWVDWFASWYNDEHRHSAISFVTPTERHQGLDAEILEQRRRVYERARELHPDRWSRGTRGWPRVEQVALNPHDAGSRRAG